MNDHLSPDVLSALVDGECDPDERRQAHEHLRGCPECDRALRAYASVHGLVSGLGRLAAPEDLVRAALRRERGVGDLVRLALRGPRRYVAAAVATAAAVITVAGVASPPDERQPPVDVLVTRHASVSAGNTVSGQVIFAVTGR